MTMTRTFEDAHGIQFTNAPMEIHTASRQGVTETTVNYHNDYIEEPHAARDEIYYNVCYWVNSGAKSAGKDCLLFSFKEDGVNLRNNWRFKVTTDYDGLTIEEAAEKHFRNFVFPEGQEAGNYLPEVLV